MTHVTSKAGSNGYTVDVDYIPMLKPAVGLYVYDQSNRYLIIEESTDTNGHTGKVNHYKVECLSGPNKGKVRWIMRSTLLSGGHIRIEES